MRKSETITVKTTIEKPMEKVWELWTKPEHIKEWNAANEDWHTTKAENDLKVGGKFSSRMEAKDGSMGFDFSGTYTAVKPNSLIEYNLDDGREVSIQFEEEGDKVKITEIFEPESQNSMEMQRGGWQAILDNFKKYAETQK